MAGVPPVLVRHLELVAALVDLIARKPLLDGGLLELDEQSLAAHLGGRHPGRFLPRDRHELAGVLVGGGGQLVGRIEPSEADEGLHYPKAFQQDDSLEDTLEALGHSYGAQLQIVRQGHVLRVRESLPLRLLEIGGRGFLLARILCPLVLDGLPDFLIAVGV